MSENHDAVIGEVDRPNVKLLFDVFHLQIMDGDIAQNIRDTIQWIAHFHTAGVPSRNEIDFSQEMNYRYIAEVIADTPFTGYVSHEWRPTPGRPSPPMRMGARNHSIRSTSPQRRKLAATWPPPSR